MGGVVSCRGEESGINLRARSVKFGAEGAGQEGCC